MKKSIGQIKPHEVNELTNHSNVQHLVSYLMKHWDISVKPHGYDKLKKDYCDFDGMPVENIKEIEDSFKGYDSATGAGSNFPEQLTTPHVVYGEVCQGRSPLHSIVSAVFSYAFTCGAKYQEIEYVKDFEKKIQHYDKMIGIIERTEKEPEQQAKSYRDEVLTIISDIIHDMYFNSVVTDHTQSDNVMKELDRRRDIRFPNRHEKKEYTKEEKEELNRIAKEVIKKIQKEDKTKHS